MSFEDSDSSGDESGSYTTTNVLLGYASKETTEDSFSALGGSPTWPDRSSPPSSSLALCKTCNGMMTLLLQLNGDLPERFPDHERRLYIFSCKKRACRRKQGSIRAIRGAKGPGHTTEAVNMSAPVQRRQEGPPPPSNPTKSNIGSAIFNSSPSFAPNPKQNPFSAQSNKAGGAFASNPFGGVNARKSEGDLVSKEADHDVDTLPISFADKVRISSNANSNTSDQLPKPIQTLPWPDQSSLPAPYPSYFLDADYETLEPSQPAPSAQQTTKMETDPGSDAAAETEAFESSIDKTFQRFADRLAQNPEQVLRYEFGGTPLLYSSTDAVGQLFSYSHLPSSSLNAKVHTISTTPQARIPPCPSCSSPRVFELQLVPHVIAELEVEEEGLEGMDWGTIIMGVCSLDCIRRESADAWDWKEEWAGVQWEELQEGKPSKGKGKN